MLNKNVKQISVRFTKNLYKKINERAERERRSFNAEVNKLVEEAMERESIEHMEKVPQK